jgi:asparagine synthase (glutamine-hydrolysing)
VSAIAGIARLDGRPADAAVPARMLDRVHHRGPDGSGVWSDGWVAFGHGMLRTTPESTHERQPLASASGDLILTADARIDNRDELLRALGSAPSVARDGATDVPDCALILAAYERWGDAFCERLIGDFAVAIWDARRQALVCARDHMGVKPFYYHRSRSLFAFSSEIKQLLALPEIPRRLEETRIGDYLAGMMDDEAITFYRDIVRLPSAHRLVVTREGARMERYWTLDVEREVRYASDAEYAEGFRHHFTEAVRCRMRSTSPVGSLLSGGLDSSSIVCAARHIRANALGTPTLHTFSAIFPDVPQCDERPFIDAVLEGGGLEPHFVRGDRLGALAELDVMLDQEDEPFYTPNLFLMWAIYACARERGVRVMLDGVDGDSTVSHGTRYLTELARAGRWNEFGTEATLLAESRKVRPGHYLRSQGFPSLTQRARAGDVLGVTSAIRTIGRHFGVSPWGVLRDCVVMPLFVEPVTRRWGRQRPGRRFTSQALIAPEFARRAGLAERHAGMRGHRFDLMRSSREDHLRRLSGGLLRVVLEVLDRVASTFSIEPRYPFCDKRLVEYCLALPADQKLRRGWTRYILRDALSGILPEKVQWRSDKGDLSTNFRRALAADRQRLETELLVNGEALKHQIDLPAVRRAFDGGSWNSSDDAAVALWKIATIAAWLRRGNVEVPDSAESYRDNPRGYDTCPPPENGADL